MVLQEAQRANRAHGAITGKSSSRGKGLTDVAQSQEEVWRCGGVGDAAQFAGLLPVRPVGVEIGGELVQDPPAASVPWCMVMKPSR